MRSVLSLLLALSASAFALDPQETRILSLMDKIMDQRPGELTLEAKESGPGFAVYVAKRAAAEGKRVDQQNLILLTRRQTVLVGDYFNLARFKDKTVDAAFLTDFLSNAMGSLIKAVPGKALPEATEYSLLQETGYGKITLRAWQVGRIHFILGNEFDLAGDPIADRMKRIPWNEGGTLGPADAPNTLAVFLDLECPHCGRLEQDLLPLLKGRQDIRAGFFQFPLTQGHPLAFKAAAASLCYLQKGNDLYMEFMDYFYPLRKDVDFSSVDLTNYGFAELKGLEEPFLACYMKEPNINAVLSVMQKAVDLGVSHTPMIYYNGLSYFPPDILTLLKPEAAAGDPAGAGDPKSGPEAPPTEPEP